VVAFVIIWKRMKVTPPPTNQNECFKFFILDFGITIWCLPWTIWCHVGTWCIMHGLSYRRVNSFFINHLHFLGLLKFCTSYTTYMLGRNPLWLPKKLQMKLVPLLFSKKIIQDVPSFHVKIVVQSIISNLWGENMVNRYKE
jgi:hypothetical protein